MTHPGPGQQTNKLRGLSQREKCTAWAPSRLSAMLVPTFADRDVYGFLNRGRYFFFQIAPKLYSPDQGYCDLLIVMTGKKEQS
jgi:hypothetical protein